jgi:hypothetical protein
MAAFLVGTLSLVVGARTPGWGIQNDRSGITSRADRLHPRIGGRAQTTRGRSLAPLADRFYRTLDEFDLCIRADQNAVVARTWRLSYALPARAY